MSFPTRRFKPKISRVRSSHSSVNQPVKIMRCPQVPEANHVVLEDPSGKSPKAVTYNPRRALLKRNPKKLSPPKSKQTIPQPDSSSLAMDKSTFHVLNDDFFEEMKAVGEKLKNIEKELSKKKVLGKFASKSSTEMSTKTPKKSKNLTSDYNPIDFTDMDFDACIPLTDNSFEDSRSGGKADASKSGNHATEFIPTNAAVESVIAKIRNDIRNWRISKGLEENVDGDHQQEPSVTSNGKGEIVVREEAERETPCNSHSKAFLQEDVSGSMTCTFSVYSEACRDHP